MMCWLLPLLHFQTHIVAFWLMLYDVLWLRLNVHKHCSAVSLYTEPILSIATMAAHLVAEIDSVKKFFESRKDLPCSDNPDQMKGFVATLVHQINSFQCFGPADATALTEALKNAPYDKEGLQQIVATIDMKLMSCNQPPQSHQHTSQSGGPLGQTLKTPWCYPIESEWDILMDPKKPLSLKMTTIVYRMNMVGLANPNEQTQKWILAFILVCHYGGNMPGPEFIRNKLFELKGVIDAERKTFTLQNLKTYPEHAADLPAAIYTFAYPKDPPVEKELEGINTAGAKCIALRSNSKLLKLKTKPQDADKALTVGDLHDFVAKVKAEPAVNREPVSCGVPAVIPVPDDHDEVELYLEYQRKMCALKQSKIAAAGSSVNVKQELLAEPTHGSISVARGQDGKLVLTPKGRNIGAVAAVKAESATEVNNAEPKGEPKAEAPEAMCNDQPTLAPDALDKYAETSLQAFAQRHMKRKLAAKQRAAEERAAKALAKRPASNIENQASANADATGVAAVKVEVSKATIMNALPTKDPVTGKYNPVRYMGGVIYSAPTQRMFRVLTTAGDKYTETRHGWESDVPNIAAWKQAIASIEHARAQEMQLLHANGQSHTQSNI